VQDVALAGADDPAILNWAAENDRIVLTHDRATMPSHAMQRVTAGLKMPGALLINDRLPVGQAIDEIILISECTDDVEWYGKVVYLPI